jgi:hypothetical protein
VGTAATNRVDDHVRDADAPSTLLAGTVPLAILRGAEPA